jgi:1-deoxy-D-xylulose-5-phosphate synthase
LAILSIGKTGIFVQEALKILAAENISAAHFDLRFVKPIDEQLLIDVFSGFSKIITVEDGAIKGGFGSAVLEFMAENGFSARVKVLGIPDKFIEHGSLEDLYTICGIDTGGIISASKEMVDA